MKVISRLNSPKCTFFKLFSHIFRGNLFEGSSIKKFESNLGKYIGVKHVSSVSSARYGLYIIMKSLNINKGKDEIIMPSYMPPIVGLIAKLCGLKIVFADINPNTYNIDPAEIEKKITKNTKILLIVHLYGVPCDMDKIMKIVKKHNIFLIEDAAQALGASYKGKKVGSFGDASVVSFGYCKNINTLCGGVVLTNNDLLNNKIKNELKQLPLPKRITLIKRAFSSQSKR